ncbi:hypothetical protein LOTGIDRAFT_228886 [Lottia gigantea]|uniref:Uncharacterized protein n=1 Tax=Lottia gigantea TaxID=225164 RepID=V4BK36_LOTGI|nr:hypothetical protein LOTGIDRAFT_228886 [Lottia gigantea]ESO88914.1 hypothetical protein LOTGIDRAFT_228886 [Lottia gigantea]
MEMEVIFGLWCFVYSFLAVACDDSTPDPNRIQGEVTKEDTSDLTVGIALGVGTFLLLVAFLIVIIINKVKNRRQRNEEIKVENGQSTVYSNGNNNKDNKNQIPLHDVKTISVQDDVPNNENQTVVSEKVEEVKSASVKTDTSKYDDKADAQDKAEGAVTELEDLKQDNNKGETKYTSVLAAGGAAVAGGAGLIGGLSLLSGDNSDDPAPDLKEQIEDKIDNEVIENAPQTIEKEINDNQFVKSAFMVGAGSDSEKDNSEKEPSDKESEKDFEDTDEPDIPAPPPSVDYLESVEHELAEETHGEEYPEYPPVIPTEDDVRELGEDHVIPEHSPIDDADFQPSNTVGSDTDNVDYDRDFSEEVPSLPSDHHETISEKATAYIDQVDTEEQVKEATTKVTTTATDSSESDYLRSLLPPPLDMDNIVIISKD